MTESKARTASRAKGRVVGGDDRPARSGRTGVASEATGVGFLGKTTLKKAGGSLIMTVPASARNLLGLTEGQEMAVRVEGRAVIAEPLPPPEPEGQQRARRPKYTLDELVAGMSPDAATGGDAPWMDAPPAGRELW